LDLWRARWRPCVLRDGSRFAARQVSDHHRITVIRGY
jgi:hypothetical protein